MPVTNTVLVGEAVAGEAAQTRQQLEDLINSANKSSFDIGDLLKVIKRRNFLPDGCATLQEYVKTLDIKARKAQYLRRISEVFEVVGVDRSNYEPLGLAKCREITSLNPDATWTNPQTNETTPMKEFIVGLAERAPEMSVEQIKEHVRTLKGLVGDNDIVWLNLPFLRSIVENVINPTMELTRQNIGSGPKDDEGVSKDATPSQCIEVWAVEYRNDPAHSYMRES